MPRPRHRNELMMTNNTTSNDPRWLATGALALLAALLASGWQPYDRVTWLMEVAPVLIVLPLLAVTRRSHPLTPLLYALIFAHARPDAGRRIHLCAGAPGLLDPGRL
jgi:hypothetical protein